METSLVCIILKSQQQSTPQKKKKKRSKPVQDLHMKAMLYRFLFPHPQLYINFVPGCLHAVAIACACFLLVVEISNHFVSSSLEDIDYYKRGKI